MISKLTASMQRPLISIIMTVLNGANTLAVCLESIACQSFTDYELVVIDGGSTDGTLEMLESISTHRVTLRQMQGIGLYAGLNVGIKVSVGRWLYFMGSDDCLFDCNVLMKVSKAIKADNEKSKIMTGIVKYAKQGYMMRPRTGSPYLLQYRLHHQGTFYHFDLFKKYLYDEDLLISSDYEFNLKLAIEGVPHNRMNDIISIFGEGGISSIKPNLFFQEVELIHKRVFSSYEYIFVSIFFKFKKKIFLLRRKYGLLNLEVRIKKFFTYQW